MSLILKVALDIPSGKLVCGNDFRTQYPVSDYFDVNETVGKKQTIEAYAKAGMFHGFCGNSCPGLYVDGNKLSIASARYDEENDETIDPGLGKHVGSICTDLWWYSVADYKDFIARGGKRTKMDPVIDVAPGRYVLSHELELNRDDGGLEVFATIEKSNELIVPWKMPEEGAAEEITKLLPAKYLTKEVIDLACPKDVDPKSWKESEQDKYTRQTRLYVKTAFEKPAHGDYITPQKKIGYELWGLLFDGEVEDFIDGVIVNAEQIQDYQYMADRAVASFEDNKDKRAHLRNMEELLFAKINRR